MFVVDAARQLGQTVVRAAEGAFVQTQDAVDPMQLVAAYLQPVQSRLGTYLVPMRGLRGVLTWHDPALTSWLCLLLAAATITLPFLPWLLVSRLVGFAALGPHMWLLGMRSRAAEAQAKREEQEAAEMANRYAEARSASARRALISEERRRREHQARVAEEEEAKCRAGLPHAAHALRRRELGAAVVEVRGSRVTYQKVRCHPDLERSAARPLKRNERFEADTA